MTGALGMKKLPCAEIVTAFMADFIGTSPSKRGDNLGPLQPTWGSEKVICVVLCVNLAMRFKMALGKKDNGGYGISCWLIARCERPDTNGG